MNPVAERARTGRAVDAGIVLAALAALAVPAALLLVFLEAPVEATMGIVQKIFYFHVGSAITMMVSFLACGVAGIVYLAGRRSPGGLPDAIGAATAEVGVVMGAIVLVTGPLWAHEAWGTWWTWEPRLTLSLTVELLFMAYLALRSFAGDDRFTAGVAAGLAVLGIPAVYFIHFAVQRWGGAHPQVVYKGGLTSPSMKVAFFASVAAMLLLGATAAYLRAAVIRARSALDEMFLELDRRRLESPPEEPR